MRRSGDRPSFPHTPSSPSSSSPLPLLVPSSPPLSPPSDPREERVPPPGVNMSQLVKSSAGGAVDKAGTACCDTGNGQTKGAELAGIKGAAAAVAPACDGAVGGETTRECICTAVWAAGPLVARVCLPRRVEVACFGRVLSLRLFCRERGDPRTALHLKKFHN